MPPGRNESCPCGSGRKYKHCCGDIPEGAPTPTRPPPDAARAWALLRSGRFAQAETECERVLAREPKLGQALLCLGLARQNQGKDALAAFESASRALAGDAQAHYVLGQALEEHDLLERAAESFGRAIALRPGFAEAHNDLGQVLLRLGRTAAAIASCGGALALRPRFAAALGNLANAERARGELAAAIEGYRQVIVLEPGLAEAHRNLGSALLETGDREAAIHSLQRAIELRPEFSKAVTQLARALSAAGRGAEAIPHFERLLRVRPADETLDEYAALLAGLGRYEASASCYRDLLGRTPRDARLHANLGHVLHCLGDFRAAIEHCRRAIELEPRLPEGHLHLGNSLLALNALFEAEAAYVAGLGVALDQ